MKIRVHSAISPIIIGVAGGSGSGKTTLCREVIRHCPVDISLVSQDYYYKDLCHLPKEERSDSNFDHPDAIDNNHLFLHLRKLKNSRSIQVPDYNFTDHTRTGRVRKVSPARVVLVEGVMLFDASTIKNICDYKVYVRVDPDIRFIRRLQRDIAERGRSVDSVVKQYLSTVKPMHDKNVRPYAKQANLILNGLNLQDAVNQLTAFINTIVS